MAGLSVAWRRRRMADHSAAAHGKGQAGRSFAMLYAAEAKLCSASQCMARAKSSIVLSSSAHQRKGMAVLPSAWHSNTEHKTEKDGSGGINGPRGRGRNRDDAKQGNMHLQHLSRILLVHGGDSGRPFRTVQTTRKAKARLKTRRKRHTMNTQANTQRQRAPVRLLARAAQNCSTRTRARAWQGKAATLLDLSGLSLA